MQRLLLIITVLLSALNSYAQVVIDGHVRAVNNNESIADANIM